MCVKGVQVRTISARVVITVSLHPVESHPESRSRVVHLKVFPRERLQELIMMFKDDFDGVIVHTKQQNLTAILC